VACSIGSRRKLWN